MKTFALRCMVPPDGRVAYTCVYAIHNMVFCELLQEGAVCSSTRAERRTSSPENQRLVDPGRFRTDGTQALTFFHQRIPQESCSHNNEAHGEQRPDCCEHLEQT